MMWLDLTVQDSSLSVGRQGDKPYSIMNHDLINHL